VKAAVAIADPGMNNIASMDIPLPPRFWSVRHFSNVGEAEASNFKALAQASGAPDRVETVHHCF
jgi:hypothetical protein